MKIIIPMAGLGTRFQSVSDIHPEYKKPKPLIDVLGKPMIYWALKSLPFVQFPNEHVFTRFYVTAKDLSFVILKKHNDEYSLGDKLRDIFTSEITVIVTPHPTRGACETALKAQNAIKDLEDDLIISDSDHYFDGTFLYNEIASKNADIDGIIPVFAPSDQNPRWSYSLVGKNNTILKVAEKDADLAARGAYANIGAYYFSSCKLFFDEARHMIQENDMTGEKNKKEFYVAPLYDRLIKKGKKMKAVVCPNVWGLGTPHDLERFLTDFSSLSFPDGDKKNSA